MIFPCLETVIELVFFRAFVIQYQTLTLVANIDTIDLTDQFDRAAIPR